MRGFVVASLLLAACSPYERRAGEYYAGPVDPAAFPSAYLGAGGDPKHGGGEITAATARAHDDPAPYYAFPFPPSQARADDPLLIAAAPSAYVIDPRPPASPYPTTQKCAPPPGYVFDARRDGYRLDEQGAVFTALPTSSYAPIVAEVQSLSNGEACQSLKSERTLVTSTSVITPLMPKPRPLPNDILIGKPDGNYLAWAIVDPSAEVRFPDGSLDPSTGVGPQKIGWYDHYLVTYLDGGYAPVSTVVLPGMGGNPDTTVVHLIAQNVYWPTQIPVTLPSGVVVVRAGRLGAGFDILDARRGEPGYSPVCHVFSFVPADPLHPPTNADHIDASQLHDTGSYVYCLQVAR